MSDIPTLPPSTAEVASASRTRRRGKASKQKHQDEYRKRKNVSALEAIHRGARERTFEGIDEQLDILSKLHVSKAKTVVQLPITTRGIGFLSVTTFDFLNGVAPRVMQINQITPLFLYKIGLLQLAAKLSIASTVHHDLLDSVRAPSQSTVLSYEVIESAKTICRQTLMPFSIVAEICGFIPYNVCDFLTFVPLHGFKTIGSPQDVAQTSTPTKRKAISGEGILPNPYYVTMQSARQVVVALSDPETPHEVRHYFRHANPIPMAMWNNQDLLINPDQLFPQNWDTPDQIRRLTSRYNAMISGAANKIASLLGTLPLDGKGDPCATVSEYQFPDCRVEMIDDAPVLELGNYGSTRYRTTLDIESSRILRGGLALVGEYPLDCRLLPVDRSFAPRYPTVSTRSIEFDWHSVFNACCQKR